MICKCYRSVEKQSMLYTAALLPVSVSLILAAAAVREIVFRQFGPKSALLSAAYLCMCVYSRGKSWPSQRVMKIHSRGDKKWRKTHGLAVDVLSRLIIFATLDLMLLPLLLLLPLMAAEGSQMIDVAHRQIRALSYPEESEMGIFFALAVPLDDPVSTKAISVAFFFEAIYKLPNDFEGGGAAGEKHSERRTRSIDRRTVYNVLESKFEDLGFPGKQCLLRSICETSRERDRLLHQHNGLIGDLMRITFTPSSSLNEGLPIEYRLAERMDHLDEEEDDCGTIYHLCPISIYQYITDVLD